MTIISPNETKTEYPKLTYLQNAKLNVDTAIEYLDDYLDQSQDDIPNAEYKQNLLTTTLIYSTLAGAQAMIAQAENEAAMIKILTLVLDRTEIDEESTEAAPCANSL